MTKMYIGSRQSRLMGFIAFALGSLVAVQAKYASGQYFAFPGMRTVPAANERLTTLEAATLQTVPEQETFKLRRAKEFADDGDFRSANALWQSVLDLAGSQLTTNDQWRYRSTSREYVKFVTVASQIESILSKLSTEGLASYRLKADAEARALLNHPANRSRMDVLSEVVRRFFLSSEGDEAAFELACLKMDSYDFNDASRLLKKCLDEHPECTVPRKEILLRLSVANARIGDSTSSVDILKQLSTADLRDKRIAVIEQSLTDLRSSVALGTAGNNRFTKYGDAESSGTMGSIAKDYFPNEVSERWSNSFDVKEAEQINNPYAAYYGDVDMETVYAMSSAGIPFTTGFGRQGTIAQKAPVRKLDRKYLLGKWKQNEWNPVGHLLLNDGLVYFKNGERVVCSSLETGDTKWLGKSSEYQLDPATAMSKMMMGSGSSKIPKKSTEVQLFGDQVYHSMSISDGKLYCLEGPTDSDPKAKPAQPQAAFNLSMPSRGRRNWLAAYDAQGGALLWRRSGHDESVTDSNFDIGFSTAPVSGGGFAYTTINDNGAISLLAINPENGKTAWKTYLCDEPIGRCLPWATNAIAYSGGDVYVGTGAGIIAAVESVSGVVRWVVRYERTGTSREMPSPFGVPMSSGTAIGWREDVVVPKGRSLLVMGSDSDMLFSLDRRTGELIWDAPRQLPKREVDYYLGVIGKQIYVAGKKCVRCYDIERGTVVWDSEIENSFGKGFVARDAIYVPSASSIVRMSTEDGTELGRSKLVSATSEPVGNLYSDGKQLLAVGLSRIYSLENVLFRMEKLAKRIANGDSDGLLERMLLHAECGETDKACSDLTEAYEFISKKTLPGEVNLQKAVERACNAAVIAIHDLNLTTTQPKFVLRKASRMFEDLSRMRDNSGDGTESSYAGIRGVVYATLCSMVASRTPGLSKEVLAIAAAYEDEALMRKAVQAIAATCLAADYEMFLHASKDASELRRAVSIAGLVQSANADRLVRDLKEVLVVEKSDRIRLQCAIALANAGDRQSLSFACDLLDSTDTKVGLAASEALQAIAGQKFVSLPQAVPQQSSPQPASVPQETVPTPSLKEQWRAWIASNGETASLKLPFVAGNRLLGRTLVCNMQGGMVREYDEAGKLTWSKVVNLPFSAKGLSNGHRLVCSFSKKEVVEYDDKGKEFWRIDVAVGHPIRIQRLENGNTLVVTQNDNFVVEYRVDKSIAWQYALTGIVADAQRMPNGNTLIALLEGQVQEVNSRGEVVWSISELAHPVCAQPLDSGNLLIGLAGDGGVIEVTREKGRKQLRTKTALLGVMDVQRLEDGNTLIVDQQGVRLIDPQGENVATKLPTQSKSGTTGSRALSIVGGIVRSSSSNVNELIHRAHRF